ncbi:S-formylglutathione hydrolase [Lonepinella koalarum]|uniref:S-formylglutathione hydrolase n=1 Tax=Lonepinella koalarum TaxID=53417 RepID=A0A4R1L277_9PAST|nr:S-formylglutathione hydrolase [Lonepinella koalarum]MDH2926016.1 S-formylglutathione hydrolase [Lonepinella koalarum]TCK71167.1 S-formylglutathione hydrolase [Lonepinella koalarum]TFJ90896.1 S-formylglutathione hydrolase [Lonepinella koalarum]TYG34684.1 S-formylglutathione hydrolase [Lonepinella koalarum]
MELISENRCFGGSHRRYRHFSKANQCEMVFAIYLPPQALVGEKVPVLYWLSGLTCTDENFATKAGAQRYAAKHSVALVMPDTSPRGENVANDERYNLGQGAGFYVNATSEPWASHYQMYDYVVNELPVLIEQHFPVNNMKSIAGHSMGGHGALQIALKNPERYRSVSAFAPIVNPSQTPWGQTAFHAYLGENPKEWANYDSTELLRQVSHAIPIRIDQGLSDDFYPVELQPEKFIEIAEQKGFFLAYFMHAGYDHSYYFVSSFIGEHIAFHAQYLK